MGGAKAVKSWDTAKKRDYEGVLGGPSNDLWDFVMRAGVIRIKNRLAG